jgi:hypothetical protein
MESGMLLKIGRVYGLLTSCVCAVVAEHNAIRVALQAVQDLDADYLNPKFWR